MESEAEALCFHLVRFEVGFNFWVFVKFGCFLCVRRRWRHLEPRACEFGAVSYLVGFKFKEKQLWGYDSGSL